MKRACALFASFSRELERRWVALRASCWAFTNPAAAAQIRDQGAWLIGGASGRLYSDNCAAFHQFLRREHPDIQVYWVIDRDSPDVAAAAAIGPILYRDDFMTRVRGVRARVLILSHGIHDIPGFDDPSACGLKVRLGHGLTALKKTRPRLGHDNRSANAPFDLVPVASGLDRRSKLDWGIDPNKLKITGLARFDTLLHRAEGHVPSGRRRLLHMPTWRDDDDGSFWRSIRAFLESPELHAILKREDAVLDLFLHMNSPRPAFIAELEGRYASIEVHALADPQPLLAACNLLITDYSSVAYDVLYLSRPVILYQFDRAGFDDARGSYVDEAGSPGIVVHRAEDVIDLLDRFLSGNADLAREFGEVIAQSRRKAFDFEDDGNCRRIMQAIEARLGGQATRRACGENEER